jgi:hypothetical protein
MKTLPFLSFAVAAGAAAAIAVGGATATAEPKRVSPSAVSHDRFVLRGCIADVTTPDPSATGRRRVTAHKARGTVTLNGVALRPRSSSAVLTLTRRATGLGFPRTIGPARVSSTRRYDVRVEGTTYGSLVPSISGRATAGLGRALANDDHSYDCSFDPSAGAGFRGFEWLSNLGEVRCEITPTAVKLGATVKLPSQLTAGVELGADIDLSIGQDGVVQTASVRLLDTPIDLGPLVTEELSVTYNRTLNRWTGTARIEEGGDGALFQGRLGGFSAVVEIDVAPFRVRRLETEVKTPSLLLIGQGLGPAFQLNRIGFKYVFNGPSFTLGGVIGGEGSIAIPGSTLPVSVLGVSGNFEVDIPTAPNRPYVVRIGGEADFSQGWGALSASLAGGSGRITYSTAGRLDFEGRVQGGFGRLPLVGDLAGAVVDIEGSLTANAFSATGIGSVFVNVPLVGRFSQETGRVTFTSRGFGFCVLGDAAHYARTWTGQEAVGLGCNLSSVQ